MNPTHTSQAIALQFNTMIQHPQSRWCWGDAPQNGKLAAKQGSLCFLGRSQLITNISSSSVPSCNEGRRPFVPLLRFLHSHPRSRFSCEPVWRELFGRQPAGLPGDWIQLHHHGSRNAPGAGGTSPDWFSQSSSHRSSCKDIHLPHQNLGDPGILKVEQL